MDEETIVFGESPVTPGKSIRSRVRGKAIPQLEDITENDAVTSKPSPATPTRRSRLRHTSLMEEIDSPNEKATPQRVTRQRRASLLQDIVEKDTGLSVDASPRALRAAKRRESKENEVLTPARRSRRLSSARVSVDSLSPSGTVRKSPRLSRLVSPVSNTLDSVSSPSVHMSEDIIPVKNSNKTSDTNCSSIKSNDIKYEGKETIVDLTSNKGTEDENRHDSKNKTKKEKRKSLSIGMKDEKEQKLNFGNDDNTLDQNVGTIEKTSKTIFPQSNDNVNSLSSTNILTTRSRTASLNVSKSKDSKIDNFFSDNEGRRKSTTANFDSSKPKSLNKTKINKSDTNLKKCLDDSFAKILKEKTFGEKIDLKSKDQQQDISEKQTEVIIQELMVPIEGKDMSSIQISDPDFPTQADSTKEFEKSNFSTEDQLVPVVSQDSAANKSTNNYLSDENSNSLRKSKRISQRLSGNNIFSPNRDYTDNREVEPMDVDITRTNSVIYCSKSNESKIDTPSISSNENTNQFCDKSDTNIHLETSKSDKRNDNYKTEEVNKKKDISNNSENSNCQSKSTFILSVNKSNDDSIKKSSSKAATPVKLSSNDSTHEKNKYTKLKEIATDSPIVQGMMTTSTPVDVAKMTEKRGVGTTSGKHTNKCKTEKLIEGSTIDKETPEKTNLNGYVKELPHDEEVEESNKLKNQEVSKTLPKLNTEIPTKRTEVADILDATTLNESKSELSSSDSESSEHIFLDRDAVDAGDAYQSGDSMNSSTRNEIEVNEIPVKGVSINSEDTVSSNSETSEYEKDSFVVSTENDEEGMSESDELTQSDLDLDMSSKSKAKYNKRKMREQKKASREMFEARHSFQLRDKSKLNDPETSESELDEIVTQTKRKARMRIESTMDTSNDETEITIQNVSFKKDPLSLSKIKHEEISIADASMVGDSENINNDPKMSVILDEIKGANEQDDESLSANEEIANDYAFLLEKLRTTSKKLSLTDRKSFSALQNKEKTPKNKVLEELNITSVKNKPEKIKSNNNLQKSHHSGPKTKTGKFQDASMTEMFDVEMESVNSKTSIEKHSNSNTTNIIMSTTHTKHLSKKLQKSTDSLELFTKARKTAPIEPLSFQENPPSEKINRNEDIDELEKELSIFPTIFHSEIDRNELSAREEGKEHTNRSDDSVMRQPKHRVSPSKEQEQSEQSVICSPSKHDKLDNENCNFSGLLNKDTKFQGNVNENSASALKSKRKDRSRNYDTDKKLLEIDAFEKESEKPQNPEPVQCVQTGTRKSKTSKILTEHKKRANHIEPEKYIFENKHNQMTEKMRDNTGNKAKKRKSSGDVQPTNAHEISRLPAELLAQLEDEPQPKKRKQTSTSDFVVENVHKSSKPSHYLEESVHIEFNKKKQSVNRAKTKKKGTVSKILPSVPNATTSGSGFTTSFKVCVLNETTKPVAKAYDFSSFKTERFHKVKRTEASGYVNKFKF